MAEKVPVSLLGDAFQVVNQPSILRRMLFARACLPDSIPKLWEIVAQFSTYKYGSSNTLLPSQVMMLAENLTFIDEDCLTFDSILLKELVFMPFASREHLGLILISEKQQCVSCNGKLLLRSDRPSKVSIYTESHGTLPGLHYCKYCSNGKKGCNIVQHYGYHTKGLFELYYDTDWEDLQYFISSQQTAFELVILQKFDFELLIGQLSYKQRTEIYNATYGYEAI